MAQTGNILSSFSLGIDLIDSSLQLLRYVHIAKGSDLEISRSSLQLRLLELRYSRCAKAYRALAHDSNNEGGQLLKETFETHEQMFIEAKRTVSSLSSGEPTAQTSIEEAVERVTRSREYSRRDSGAVANGYASPGSRPPQTLSFGDQVRWVLFKRQEFHDWITTLTRNIEHIESLLPNKETQNGTWDQLRRQEVQVLSQVSRSENRTLLEALDTEPKVHPDLSNDLRPTNGPTADVCGNTWIHNKAEREGRQRNGDFLSANAVLRSRENRWESNIVSLNGRQHNGNSIVQGRDNFWDS